MENPVERDIVSSACTPALLYVHCYVPSACHPVSSIQNALLEQRSTRFSSQAPLSNFCMACGQICRAPPLFCNLVEFWLFRKMKESLVFTNDHVTSHRIASHRIALTFIQNIIS
jgi:hypothetical protein